MSKTALFEQEVPLSPETLKAYFQQNDFSSQISGYDIDKADANESRVFVKVRKQFRATWEKQLKTLANRSSMRNFSSERLEADGFQFTAPDVFDAISEQLLESLYLERLDEVQKEIYYLRMNGFTQKEIAERLGYKTHSAVTKKMQKMREKFTELKKYLEG